MLRLEAALLVTLLLLPGWLALAAEDEKEPTAAGKQYAALLAEYEQEGGARLFARRFLDFAEKHPDDAAAVDALVWVAARVRGRDETDQALQRLAEHHLERESLATACGPIAASRSAQAEKLLRAILEKSPHDTVKSQACLSLAALLDAEATIVEQLKAQPELAPRVLQYYGADYGKHLSSLDASELDRQREQVYDRMLQSFANVELQGGTMGELAQQKLFQLRHLSAGKVAPEIRGEDVWGEEFKLSDYRGKVVLLTFWGHW